MSQNAQRPKPIVFKRLVRLLLLVCLAIYLVLVAVVGFFQRRLIYVPPVFTSQQVDQMAQSSSLERWTNSSGQFIGLKRLLRKKPAEGSILIAYGNGSYAAGYSFRADELQSAGAFDVFVLEYPGYADRPGSPSQSSLFQAADEAFQTLPTNQPIYLIGESLGTGVASYLAGTFSNKVAGIILISPFDRLTGVAQYHYPFLPVRLLLVDRYPSEDYLRNYHGPVSVVVDGHDQVIPERFGLMLYNGYAGPKRLWEFPLGEHTDIWEPPAKFWGEVVAFWQTK